MSEKQQQQKQAHDSRVRARNLVVGDMVYARGYGRGQPHWIPAQIVQRTGPVSFKVELDSGGVYCRHQDQLRKRLATTTDTSYPDTATDATPDATETLLPRPFPLNIPEATPEVPELPSLILTSLMTQPRVLRPLKRTHNVVTPQERGDHLKN